MVSSRIRSLRRTQRPCTVKCLSVLRDFWEHGICSYRNACFTCKTNDCTCTCYFKSVIIMSISTFSLSYVVKMFDEKIIWQWEDKKKIIDYCQQPDFYRFRCSLTLPHTFWICAHHTYLVPLRDHRCPFAALYPSQSWPSGTGESQYLRRALTVCH